MRDTVRRAQGIILATNTIWRVTDREGDSVAAVPEPASLAMLGVPAVLLLRRQSRRQRA